MKDLISIIITRFFSVFPIDKKKIIFETGKYKIEGNPLAIYKYIKENCKTEFKTIWLISKKTDINLLESGDYKYYKTIASFYHLATAKFWLRSNSIGSIIKKRRNQIYIQTWHGAGAFKKCGYDIKKDENSIQMKHTLEWDCYIASDLYNANMIKTSTGYNKEIKISVSVSKIKNIM